MSQRLCTQVDCTEAASHLCMESHTLAMLFKSGAGFVCQKHAQDLARIGGVSFAMTELVAALKEADVKEVQP